MKKLFATLLACGTLAFAAWSQIPAGAAGETPGFHAPVVLPQSWGEDRGGGGTEPSLAITNAGVRYPSWQVPGEFAKSPDGVHFQWLGFPDPDASGDVTNAIDAAGVIYNVQICGGVTTLHNCLYKSYDGGQTWTAGSIIADSHPGAADRPWIDVYPKKTDTPWDPANTIVYLEYHTFSPEELAYVTVSHDGGDTFSEPKFITTDTNAINGSGCNTVPGGVIVDQSNGNVYAVWLSGNDVESNVQTGCNYSQIGPFNKAWVSTSTDQGETWAAHNAWTGAFDMITKVGDNASKIFAPITVDQGGQLYVALPVRHNDDPVTFAATGTETPQPTDLDIVVSPDQGATWTEALKVNQTEGSYFFPWLAGGSTGIIDAVYYRSSTLQPNDPASKWYIGFSQIRNLTATPGTDGPATFVGTPTVSEVLVDSKPVHNGGICTFGVFCAALPGSNRNLADSIVVALDPAGGANLAYTTDARGKTILIGHGHTLFPTGIVHVKPNVTDEVDGSGVIGNVVYWDQRTDPPGPISSPIKCTGQGTHVEALGTKTVRATGGVQCDNAPDAASYVLVVTDRGPDTVRGDAYHYTLFDADGNVLYDFGSVTTLNQGDIRAEAVGQVAEDEDSHIEFACQQSGPSAYEGSPAVTGCFKAAT